MLEKHPNLVDYVKQGNVILFLGAGASLSATDEGGNKPPLAKKLGQLLSDKFLGGEMADSSLSEIAECSISSTNTTTVQEYVKDVFEPFKPGLGHQLLTKFSWAGLATTNYDLLVEDSFEKELSTNQTLRPVAHDGQVSRIIESTDDLPYLKLHGCFNNMGPKGIKLVLSLDQYLDYEKERTSLFDTFEEWARKYTFVFIGYGAQDLNIRKYITRLVDNVEDRMRFYFVKPRWADAERQMWETRKVTPIEADFDGFMTALDTAVGDEFRGMRIEVQMPPNLRGHLSSDHFSLSKNASLFFQNDALFIESAEMIEGGSAKNFFNGDSSGWNLILNNWDAVRDVVEDVIIEVVLDEGQTKEKDCELVLLRGYAGSGKTIALKRLGWELVSQHDGVGVFLERPENLNSAAISELAELTKKRIYIFIDDIGNGLGPLRKCVKGLGPSSKMVTFVAGVRTSDWNRLKGRSPFIAIREYELGDLSHGEILRLVEKLKSENCLGELEGLSDEDCVTRFKGTARKNLLVALYEVTKGKPFEDIVVDEYETLASDEARAVYLTVCMLNRLNVPVRAMLLSRIHGIPYGDFRGRIFDPLEGVVSNRKDNLARDYVYSARHPYIADIVFKTILTDQDDRFDEYFKVLKMINLSYQSDEIAFKELVRGRILNDLFSDTTYVEKIFQVAEEKCQRDPNIFHQRAVFEMRRNNGDLDLAQEYIDLAIDSRGHNPFFKHTAAELLLRRAERSDSNVVKERLLRRAERACKNLASTSQSSHAKHTLAKIGIARAQTYLAQSGDEATLAAVRDFIKPAQLDVEASLQLYPGDSYLLDAKAKLAKRIGDSHVVLSSLEEAFKNNHNIVYIALQLHSCYLEKEDFFAAEDVLQKCLEGNRNNRSANYAFGKFLMDQNRDPNLAMVHLRRAFVPGDKSFDAQMRFGRECYRAGQFDLCEKHFHTVRITQFPPRLSSEILYEMDETQKGLVLEVHARFLLIRDTNSGLEIRGYRNSDSEDVFREATASCSIEYRLGVGIHGLRAVDLALG